jgi:hypothetical protein
VKPRAQIGGWWKVRKLISWYQCSIPITNYFVILIVLAIIGIAMGKTCCQSKKMKTHLPGYPKPDLKPPWQKLEYSSMEKSNSSWYLALPSTPIQRQLNSINVQWKPSLDKPYPFTQIKQSTIFLT